MHNISKANIQGIGTIEISQLPTFCVYVDTEFISARPIQGGPKVLSPLLNREW